MSASLYKRNVAAQTIVEDENGVGVQINQHRVPVLTVGAVNRTLTPQESGVVLLPNIPGFRIMLIPEPADVPGRYYRFILTDGALTDNWLVQTISDAEIIEGNVSEMNVGSAVTDVNGVGTNGTPISTITFINALANAGDYVELISSGTTWFLSGQVAVRGAVTLS